MTRVALVTGGSRGIGAAISKALKAAGYKVAANYAGNDERARAFTERWRSDSDRKRWSAGRRPSRLCRAAPTTHGSSTAARRRRGPRCR